MRSWSSLRHRADFLKLNQNCQKWVTPAFIVQLLRNEDTAKTPEIGFTATKKIGGAVMRNRCKRRLRAVCDDVLKPLDVTGYQIVLIARHETLTKDYSDLTKDLRWALKRLGIEAGEKITQ